MFWDIKWILILGLIRVWLWGVAAIMILSLQYFSAVFHPHGPRGAHIPPLFSPLLYLSSKLPVALSVALFLAAMFHMQQSTRFHINWVRACLKWEAGHLISPAAAEKDEGKKNERRSWNGLSLMTDNPVTNSWSSSKGWLSRLWLCDVNGTWSSGSAEAQREGSQFSVRLPQTCPLLWFSSTHFDLKLSGLLSCCVFFLLLLLMNESKDFSFFFCWHMSWGGKRSYCRSVLRNPSLDYLAPCQLLTRVCY